MMLSRIPRGARRREIGVRRQCAPALRGEIPAQRGTRRVRLGEESRGWKV